MTILAAISPDILTPWSDRDLSFDLQPDEGLQVYRDGNKQLRLADPVGGLAAAKKYRLTISGDDLWGFAYGSVWVGTQFTVDLSITLWHALPSGTNTVTLERTVVPGSTVVARTKDGADLTVVSVVDGVVTVGAHLGQTAYVGYRPRLTMLLADNWALRFQDNTHTAGNAIVLREV